MTTIYEVRKIVHDKIDKGEPVPHIIKRCPKCQNLSLIYDHETNKIKCSKCGFEQTLQVIK